MLERGGPLHCSEPDHLGRSEQFVADAHHDRAGDIVIGHMNRPGRGTAAGVAQTVPTLLDKGVSFVRLREGFA